jgi:hypothetical protein
MSAADYSIRHVLYGNAVIMSSVCLFHELHLSGRPSTGANRLVKRRLYIPAGQRTVSQAPAQGPSLRRLAVSHTAVGACGPIAAILTVRPVITL